MEFTTRKVFTIKSFYELVKQHYDIPFRTARKILDGLLRNNELEELEDNGTTYYRLLED